MSQVAMLYFTYLVYISYFPIQDGGVIRVIGELLTIPLLLGVFVGFVYSLVQLVKRKEPGHHLLILAINSITLIFLIIVTVIQLKD